MRSNILLFLIISLLTSCGSFHLAEGPYKEPSKKKDEVIIHPMKTRMCPDCINKDYPHDTGICIICNNKTASSKNKLCSECGVKMKSCEACGNLFYVEKKVNQYPLSRKPPSSQIGITACSRCRLFYNPFSSSYCPNCGLRR